jgi:tetratricopeptide (TPR) repeat protein
MVYWFFILSLGLMTGAGVSQVQSRLADRVPSSSPKSAAAWASLQNQDADAAGGQNEAFLHAGLVGPGVQPLNLKEVLQSAESLLSKGDYRGAAQQYETLLKLAPGIQEAHFALGVCYPQLGRSKPRALSRIT